MSVLGFLICVAGCGVFGWVLRGSSDKYRVISDDVAHYRKQQDVAKDRMAWLNQWAEGVAAGRDDCVIDLRWDDDVIDLRDQERES